MKFIRYRFGHKDDAYGAIVGDVVYSLAAEPWRDPTPGPVVAHLSEVKLLAPCQPCQIVAVGRNYAAHAAEHSVPVPKEPLIFLKPASSVIGPGATIVYPKHLSNHLEHEAELVAVIGRRASHVQPDEAMEYVMGYTCGNDVTARDLQRSDGQWARGKGFDTFCPLGPWIVPELDISDLRIRCRVNGEVRQDSRTREMIFGLPVLIAYISAVMTLDAGDIIMTGTPAGVSPLHPGDRVSVEIEGLGTLENEVAEHG